VNVDFAAARQRPLTIDDWDFDLVDLPQREIIDRPAGLELNR
jgi:hypothetical protein